MPLPSACIRKGLGGRRAATVSAAEAERAEAQGIRLQPYILAGALSPDKHATTRSATSSGNSASGRRDDGDPNRLVRT